jgi:hypothetical protein
MMPFGYDFALCKSNGTMLRGMMKCNEYCDKRQKAKSGGGGAVIGFYKNRGREVKHMQQQIKLWPISQRPLANNVVVMSQNDK